MADEKHEPERNCHSRQKWLPAAAILLLVLLAAGLSVRYISFMSQTIYQESTSHLEEVLHKSNNMLQEMVRKNLTYLHLYNGFLENTSNETEIQAYIEEAQQNTGFADFYFLTYDGNYMTVTGETGYLGLQTNLDEKLSDGKDIVMNTALPGKPQMLVFVCPETQGSYRGFAYDAVAIAYYNDEVLKLLDNSAFEGNASNYVIYPDGRVIIGDPSNRKETIYNFIAMLRDHSDLSEEQLLALSDAFAQGSSGNLRVKLGDTSYYPELDAAGDCAGRNRQCQSGQAVVPYLTDCSRYRRWFCCAGHSAHCAQKPCHPAPEEYRDFVPGRAVPKAFDERGRRFPDAGRQDLQGGLCQSKHRAPAGHTVERSPAGCFCSGQAAPEKRPRAR